MVSDKHSGLPVHNNGNQSLLNLNFIKLGHYSYPGHTHWHQLVLKETLRVGIIQ